MCIRVGFFHIKVVCIDVLYDLVHVKTNLLYGDVSSILKSRLKYE